MNILRRRRLIFLLLPCLACLYVVVVFLKMNSPESTENELQISNQDIRTGKSQTYQSKLPVYDDNEDELDLRPLKDQTKNPDVTATTHHEHFQKPSSNQNGFQLKTFSQPSVKLRGVNFSSFSVNDSQIISQAFTRKVVGADKSILLDIARTFDKLIHEQLNLTYFMYGGSLLGSFRHHDLIPWDDDLDLFLNFSDKRFLISELEKLYPKYEVFEAGPRLKFFSQYSRRLGRYPWNWPYVDIHFFKENSTHIWDSSEEFHTFSYPKSIVFPLHRRPLGGLRLNAPRDSLANLKATYRGKECVSLDYSHELERVEPLRGIRIPCSLLKEIYPFVYRSKPGAGVEGVKETVKIGDTELYSLVVNEPSYAITEPFSLELIHAR